MEETIIRESGHVVHGTLSIPVPDWMEDYDVDVIVLPKGGPVNPPIRQARQPDLFGYKEGFSMTSDFDEPLPAVFWTGDKA